MAVIDELLVALGFDYDPKELNQFKKDLGKTASVVKDLAKAAIAGAAAITGMAAASTAASDEQGKLADQIGESVEMVDALQFALVRSGGSADGMSSSLIDLSKRASEAARGIGEGVVAFGMLGVSVTDSQGDIRNTSELLKDISRSMQGLDKAQQIELAEKLGLGSSIRLLQQGPEAINALVMEAKALGVTTAEDAAIAAEFQDSLADVWQVTKQIARTLTRELGPIIRDNTQDLLEWWKLNRDIIEQKLPEWIEKGAQALRLLSVATGAFLAFRLVGHITSLIASLKGATLATLGMNAAALILPALLFIGATAFMGLVQDAKVFFEGGDSVMGDMIDRFPEWRDEIGTVGAVLATVAELTGMIFDGWSNIFDLFKNSSMGGFKEAIGDIPGFLGDVTGLAPLEGGGILSGVGSAISNTASTTIDKIDIVIQGGADTAENIANSVFNMFQQTTQDLNSTVDQ